MKFFRGYTDARDDVLEFGFKAACGLIAGMSEDKYVMGYKLYLDSVI